MSTAEDEEVDFIIVRLVSYVCSPPSFPWRTRILIALHYRGSKIYRMEEDESLRRKYRTDCWLEQCIYEERICAPDEQVSFIPLDIPLPVAGPSNVPYSPKRRSDTGVCSRGGRHYYLDLWIRTIRGAWTKATIPSPWYEYQWLSICPVSSHSFFLSGITLATTFTRHSTHLVCPSGVGLKFEKAHEWEIPVINVQWLATMASSGAIPQVHDFLVTGSFVPERHDDHRMQVDRKDVKGKGKAIDNAPMADTKVAMDVADDNRIHDITNSKPSLPPIITRQPKFSCLDEPLPAAPLQTSPSEPHPKKKNLEREPTVIVASSPEPERYMFGMPNHTLAGSSYIPHPSSIATPSRSSLGFPAFADPSRQGSVVSLLDGEGSGTFDFGASLARRRAATAGLDDARVPSSRSPSPMKAPLQRSTSRSSLSPMKVDHEATKALQESITSLLGKRPSPEGDDARAATGAGPAARNGKRARPQRSKVSQPSVSSVERSRP